jgi:hypothetical protein
MFRTLAVLLAGTAIADPRVTRVTSVAEPVAVVAVNDGAVSVAARLHATLAASGIRAAFHEHTSRAAACPRQGACIVISDGGRPERVTDGARVVGVLNVAPVTNDRTRLTRVVAPSRVHLEAVAVLRIETNRPAGRIDVYDGDTLVGSARPAEQTAVDVEWIPLAAGPRALRVVADDDAVHSGVMVEAGPADVFYYEPQATWLGTFVRRALEEDSRFRVRGRSRLAPPVAITRGEVPTLSASVLSGVGAAVVTGPERLTPAEVDVLDRFVRLRGGSLIVLLDEAPGSAAARILPRVTAERQHPQPQSAASLRATEWLTFASGVEIATLAAMGGQPAIVARNVGRGRVIVSGALDAWRFRQADDGFSAFWTSLAWDAAAVAGSTLRVDVDRVIARPGEPVNVSIELQSASALPDGITAMGQVDCSGTREVLRLWPGARLGTFSGTFLAEQIGECTIDAVAGDSRGAASVTIRDDLRRLVTDDGSLEALAAAHGAAFVSAGGEDELLPALRAKLLSRDEPVTYHPTRSPYWMLMFVMSVSVEWWLRRRAGLN